jgi:membrane protease YdiL (CAAX protease family)
MSARGFRETIAAGWPTLGLLAGFTAAVGLRVAAGGRGVAQSAAAGLIFAVCLAALSWSHGTRLALSRRALVIGLLGGLALCLPSLVSRLTGAPSHASTSGYLPWAIVVTIVAVAEEYFLRGALFAAVDRWLGEIPAVLIAAACFAALHVPLYGWHVIPLDLAVGLWLGALRVVARSPAAPATAHAVADLAAWWLR